MRRTITAFTTGLVIGLMAVAGVAIAQEIFDVENCVAVPGHHPKALCDIVETSTTTTSSSSTTSTTIAPTTTTTPPPTTTTTTAPPGDLVIPDTVPYPSTGFASGGGFRFMLNNAETGAFWWNADYWGENGLYTEGFASLPGDREGYRCGYGFYGETDGSNIIGRYAFVRPPGQAYGKVNDTYMDEAERYLDGSLWLGQEGNEIPDEDCTDVLSDIDYEGACRPVDERPRIGFFDGAGDVIDIRDYTNTDAGDIVFNLHSADSQRVTILACEDGLVGMIVYYDALGDGQLATDFNGVGPFADTGTGPFVEG